MSTPSNSNYNLRGKSKKTAKGQDAETCRSLGSSLQLSDASGLDYESELSTGEDDFPGELNNSDSSSSEEEIMSLNIQLRHFEGKPGEYAEDWLETFHNYCTAQRIDDGRKWCTFSFMLKGHAESWYKALPADVKRDPDTMINRFKERFNGSDGLPPDTAIYGVKQYEHEPVCDYITRITEASSRSRLHPETIAHLASEGLMPELRKMVMPQSLKTLEDVRKAALVAERCVTAENRGNISVASTAGINIDKITDKVCEQVISVLSSKFGDTLISKPQEQTWNRRRHNYQHQSPANEQLQMFQQPQPNYNLPPAYPQQFYCPTVPQQQSVYQPQTQHPASQNQPQIRQDRRKPCRSCGGRACQSFSKCPARNVKCSYCKKYNHFTETCDKKKQDEANRPQ